MSKENKKISAVKEKLGAFFDKVGTLTKVQRLVICILTFAVFGGAYYYFIYMPKSTELKKVEKTYKAQFNKLTGYKMRAKELLKYEKLMAQTQEEFNIAKRALPDKRELPSLLTGVSRAGSDAGLAFHLFQPVKEIIGEGEYYKTLPISIKVVGRYHQITDFFFQITKLNRIVNINNVDVKGSKTGEILEMSCQAATYMFVEKTEVVDEAKGKKKSRSRAKSKRKKK